MGRGDMARLPKCCDIQVCLLVCLLCLLKRMFVAKLLKLLKQPLVLHPVSQPLVHCVRLGANGSHQLLGIGLPDRQDRNNWNAQNDTAHYVIHASGCGSQNISA